MAEDDKYFHSIMESAQSLIAEGGMKALSLRSLAAHSGCGMGELNYRLGKKGNIVEKILQFSASDYVKILENFLSSSATMLMNDSQSLADVIGLYLDELYLNRRKHCITWMELSNDFALRNQWSSIIDHANSEMRGVWQAFLSESGYEDAFHLSRLISDYLAEEIPYSITIGNLAEYRLLRTAVIRRLAEGILKNEDSQDLQPLIQPMMQRSVFLAGRGTARQVALAHAAASLITEEGIAAVTHRAVAAKAKAPLSTIVHHFPTIDDLVQAALEALFDHQWQDLSRQPEPPTVDADMFWNDELLQSLRSYHQAAFQLILAANRRPNLVPAVCAIRGKRGQRAKKLYSGRIPPSDWDVGAVHLLSLIVSGRIFQNNCNEPVAEARSVIDQIKRYSTNIRRGYRRF